MEAISRINLATSKGLKVKRRFTEQGANVFDKYNWEKRDATVVNSKGEILFKQSDVEVPSFWSQAATNVVVSKYFRGTLETDEREKSIKDLVWRVANTIKGWGAENGYFTSEEDAQTFEDELTDIIISQKATFNSPVWFNVGIESRPQCSACFINSVEDDMRSILNLAVVEGILFKYGSGTGTNFSVLRSSKEKVNAGGNASGPISFLKGYDAFAGVIKSGGKTRRAAKMILLDIDHPDIIQFIDTKVEEEKKAHALIEAGYDGSFDGEAYNSVFYQNGNHSIRVSDEFMKAVEDDLNWTTKYVITGEDFETYKARDILKRAAKSAHICGDPGVQFGTTINRWNTCKNSGEINASNPCGEFMFLDDSACNLASINLMKFRMPDGTFDIDGFRHATEIMILAQEIIVDNASYPSDKIEKNSHDFRPLGLGYANLGALLMSSGLPYDSEEGRNYAAAITAVMTAHAYKTSATIAGAMGSFKYFEENREPFMKVIDLHRSCAYQLENKGVSRQLVEIVRKEWDDAYELGNMFGFRNAQTTLLAPTGTIGFMLDCDTTGIEPDIALVKYKWLVGGGLMKIINNTVPLALEQLQYNEQEKEAIIQYIKEKDTIEGAPYLKKEHLPVFDCAFKPNNGERSINWMGHIKVMGAVQPFLSGGISKTVNMPNTATVEDIENAYIETWKRGVKGIAIYRDGSKGVQPFTTKQKEKKQLKAPQRRRLPEERKALTHRFVIGGHKGFLTVGLYDDGSPGELFVSMSKEGSTISGMMDAFATSISFALQYGVPLKFLVNKFIHVRFEPSGFTSNPKIRIAKSIIDYIFRWMAMTFLKPEELTEVGLNDTELVESNGRTKDVKENGIKDLTKTEPAKEKTFDNQADAPLCIECGSIMIRSGACYKCMNCGSTSGCS